MDLLLFIKSFLVGIMASSSMGPIFILTISRSILHGFPKGFVTAMGSSLADGIYFSLALFGILHFLKANPYTTIIMNILSAIILIALSIKILLEKEHDISISSVELEDLAKKVSFPNPSLREKLYNPNQTSSWKL